MSIVNQLVYQWYIRLPRSSPMPNPMTWRKVKIGRKSWSRKFWALPTQSCSPTDLYFVIIDPRHRKSSGSYQKNKLKASEKSRSGPLSPLLDKTEQRRPIPVPGQVSILPKLKLDSAVLHRIQSKISANESMCSSSSRNSASSKGKLQPHIYSKIESHNGVKTFSGGPMIMESRSLHKLILKPEIPPGLQVVRRKTKFMENQRLRDVFSIGGGRNVRNNQPSFFFTRKM